MTPVGRRQPSGSSPRTLLRSGGSRRARARRGSGARFGPTTSALDRDDGTATTSPAPTVLVFTGHGWGHGIGMSQWGAYGYALHGWSYDRILAHYYPGTTLGPAAPTTVRVLLVAGEEA